MINMLEYQGQEVWVKLTYENELCPAVITGVADGSYDSRYPYSLIVRLLNYNGWNDSRIVTISQVCLNPTDFFEEKESSGVVTRINSDGGFEALVSNLVDGGVLVSSRLIGVGLYHGLDMYIVAPLMKVRNNLCYAVTAEQIKINYQSARSITADTQVQNGICDLREIDSDYTSVPAYITGAVNDDYTIVVPKEAIGIWPAYIVRNSQIVKCK